MTLTAFTSTVTHTALNANFDDKTATLTANAKAGKKDQVISVHRFACDANDDVSLRSVVWTQPDDAEVRVLGVSVTDGTANRTATVTLEPADAVGAYNDDPLHVGTFTASVTTVVGTAHATRSDYRTTSGTRARLLKGIRYRLKVAQSAGASTSTNGYLVTRSVRRLA